MSDSYRAGQTVTDDRQHDKFDIYDRLSRPSGVTAPAS
jgi:hypothetical protein